MAKNITYCPSRVSQHLVPSDFEICCPKDPAANDQSKLATCCVPQEPRGIMGRILKLWWTIMNKYEHVLVKSSQIFHFREEWFLQGKFQWTSTGWPDHLIRLPHLWTGILDASPLERPFFPHATWRAWESHVLERTHHWRAACRAPRKISAALTPCRFAPGMPHGSSKRACFYKI